MEQQGRDILKKSLTWLSALYILKLLGELL